LAIQNDKEKIATLLLTKGSDPNAPNVDDLRPLHRATLRGNKKIIEQLLNQGAEGTIRIEVIIIDIP
jgi:ankyrin repeat protein